MTEPEESHTNRPIGDLLVARLDEILAACAARCDRSGARCVEQACAEPVRAVVAPMARLVGVGPDDPRGVTLRRSLADAAARYGAARRSEGQPAESLPYECSLVFESLWAAVSEAALDTPARAVTVERLQHAVSVALMAAFVGYELGGDAAKSEEMRVVLARCCLRASPV